MCSFAESNQQRSNNSIQFFCQCVIIDLLIQHKSQDDIFFSLEDGEQEKLTEKLTPTSLR